MDKEMEHAFGREWNSMLDVLREKNKGISEMDYFFRLAKRESDEAYLKNRSPKVILLGAGIPLEVVMALHGASVYLAGGSFASAGWADQMVPRDTDSVIKSTLGILTQEDWKMAADALVIIPVFCDSMRKLAYMLSEKMKVLALELPSNKEDEIQMKHWKEEVRRAVEMIEKHLHKRISNRIIQEQCRILNETKEVWKRISQIEETVLSGSSKLFLANSWFFADDKARWLSHLKKLEEKLASVCRKNRGFSRPQVLLLGSPIYAPNYKVPFLLEELNIGLADLVHPMTEMLSSEPVSTDGKHFISKYTLVNQLAEAAIRQDISAAYVKNTRLIDSVKEKIANHTYDGVVVHILKGQIEYDFELNALEPLFEEHNIPVFRLETDYNYQDIEQLRIRLEAFSEMMNHRAVLYRKGA